MALGVTGSAHGSTAAPASSDDDGGGVDSGDEGVRTGTEEWKRNKSLLMAKVKQLLKIWGAVKFPVNPIPHLSQAGKRGLLGEGSVFSCLEDACAVCAGRYQVLRNVNATALTPVSDGLRSSGWWCCRVGEPAMDQKRGSALVSYKWCDGVCFQCSILPQSGKVASVFFLGGGLLWSMLVLK